MLPDVTARQSWAKPEPASRLDSRRTGGTSAGAPRGSAPWDAPGSRTSSPDPRPTARHPARVAEGCAESSPPPVLSADERPAARCRRGELPCRRGRAPAGTARDAFTPDADEVDDPSRPWSPAKPRCLALECSGIVFRLCDPMPQIGVGTRVDCFPKWVRTGARRIRCSRIPLRGC